MGRSFRYAELFQLHIAVMQQCGYVPTCSFVLCCSVTLFPAAFQCWLRCSRAGEETWLGYHRVSGQWSWMDGSVLDYLNFQGSPPAADEDCVYWVEDQTWSYATCDSEYRALCVWTPTGMS